MPKINRICDKDFVIVSTRFTPLEKAGLGESGIEEELRKKKRMGKERMLNFRAVKECPGIYNSDIGKHGPRDLFQLLDPDYSAPPKLYADGANAAVYSDVAFCPACRKMAELWEFAVLKDGIDSSLLLDPGFRNRLRFRGTSIVEIKEAFSPIEGLDHDCLSSYIRRCPNCGMDLSLYEKEEMEYRHRGLWNAGALDGRNTRLLGWDVHSKEEKIVMRLVYERYAVDTFREEVHSGLFTAAVTLNMKSGRTFALMPHSSDGKPLLPGTKMKGIQELTYGTEGLIFLKVFAPMFTHRDMLDAAWGILCERKKIARPQDDSFLSLIRTNRWGGNAAYVSGLYHAYNNSVFDFRMPALFMRRVCAKARFSALPDIHALLAALKVPDRPKTRHMVTEHPSCLESLLTATRMGFRNYDLIVQAVERGIGHLNWAYQEDETVASAFRFMKTLIKVRGENRAFRLLFPAPAHAGDHLAYYLEQDGTHNDTNRLFQLLTDCGRMYKECVDAGFLPELTGRTITEVHDTLCVLLNEDIGRARAAAYNADGEISALRDAVIPYTKEERKLEGIYGTYRFFLLHDAAQFVQLGQVMYNCVAAYADRAVMKAVIILVMVGDSGVSACIELRKEKSKKGEQGNFLLIQAKGKFNHYLNPVEKETVVQWMKENGICKGKSCMDI